MNYGLYSPRNSPGQNTGVKSLSLLQGIFPTQGSNPGLPHCRQILYQLSHKGRNTGERVVTDRKWSDEEAFLQEETLVGNLPEQGAIELPWWLIG